MTKIILAVGGFAFAWRYTRRQIRRTWTSQRAEGWGGPGDPRNDVDELEFSPGAVERMLRAGSERGSAKRKEPSRIQRDDFAKDGSR